MGEKVEFKENLPDTRQAALLKTSTLHNNGDGMVDPIIAVFLRSDVGWGSLSEDSYLEQEKFNRSVIRINPARKRELLTKIKFWNQAFSMSWFEYRQEIKNIAELNRSQIHNVDLVIRKTRKPQNPQTVSCVNHKTLKLWVL